MRECTENFEFEVMRLKVGGSRPSHEWLQILLSVSDHWRSVALSTVELFSRIDIIYPSMISFYLTVSQGIPLEIRGRINKTNTRWNVLSSEDIDRVVALRVYTKMNASIPKTWPETFLNLESLSVTLTERYCPKTTSDYSAFSELLARSPRLTSLAVHLIRGGTASWMPFIATSSLTRLRIYGWQGWEHTDEVPEEAEPGGIVQPFVALIQRLPHLDRLELMAFRLPSDVNLRGPFEELPHTLSVFEANGALTSIAMLLQSRVITPRSLLITAFHYEDSDDEDIPLTFSNMINTLGVPVVNSITSASICVGTGSESAENVYIFSVKGWTPYIPFTMHSFITTPPILDFTLNIRRSRGKDEGWAESKDATIGSALARALTDILPEVESVSVIIRPSGESPIDINMILDHICNGFRHLRNLQMPAFDGAFQTSVDPPMRWQTDSLPELSSLGVVFQPPFSIQASRIAGTIQDLQNYLSSRSSVQPNCFQSLSLSISDTETWTQTAIMEKLGQLRGLVGELRLQGLRNSQ